MLARYGGSIRLASLFALTISPMSARGEDAARDLPDRYTAGAIFGVSISVEPPVGTLAVGLEDTHPGGWTASNISDGGLFDSDNGKVKWGPFFAPSIPSVVTYDMTPPAEATGEHCFGCTAGNGSSCQGALA